MVKVKVCIVLGTRPEVIKFAPIIHQIRRNSFFKTVVISTGQHREMLDQMLEIFSIEPDYDLQLMVKKQSLSGLTSGILEAIEPIYDKEKPDVVLTQGDTTSAFAASLAAFYNRIRVGHVEAGLRTYQKFFPYPEEVNRKLISAVCDWHFAPTEESYQNLVNENIAPSTIFKVGNTVVDALEHILENNPHSPLLGSFDLCDRKLVLVTAHRRENHGDNFTSICTAIRQIADENENAAVLYPVHLNPNIREAAYDLLKDHPNILLTPPLNYVDFVHLLKNSHVVLTDSGGVQEEAPVFGKPVIVLRDVTERPEGVKAGVAKLVGSDKEMIVRETGKLLCDEVYYSQMSQAKSLYGDGKASQRIIDILAESFGYLN